MRIVVIGGGPAGARASRFLALAGHGISLVEPQGAWEKPCGAELTAKAWMLDAGLDVHVPSTLIDGILIHFGDARPLRVLPPEPLVVLSRTALGRHLIEAAVAADRQNTLTTTRSELR